MKPVNILSVFNRVGMYRLTDDYVLFGPRGMFGWIRLGRLVVYPSRFGVAGARRAYVDQIFVKDKHRDRGHARRVMEQLNDAADEARVTLMVTPVPRLDDFCKSLGYVENKGRRKDKDIPYDMYRKPRTT